MKWDLEERLEDAIVAYLKTQITAAVLIVAAWEREERGYPRVVVHAGTSGPVSEPAAWHDARRIMVQVAVLTEGAAIVDNVAHVLETARARNADMRSRVMDALCVGDLCTRLNAVGIDALALSMAQVITTERSMEAGALVTTVTVETIAEPVTGS